MKKRWEYKIGHYWEQLPVDKEYRPHSYAEKEHADFLEALDDGWEPVCGWGHAGGSAWRSHVMLRRRV